MQLYFNRYRKLVRNPQFHCICISLPLRRYLQNVYCRCKTHYQLHCIW